MMGMNEASRKDSVWGIVFCLKETEIASDNYSVIQ